MKPEIQIRSSPALSGPIKSDPEDLRFHLEFSGLQHRLKQDESHTHFLPKHYRLIVV